MKLHEYPEQFRDLISIVAEYKHLPEAAIERDYYIVLLLKNLSESEFADRCVFKGGTSLSKCYPGSIERFSEDIDLTYLGEENLSDNKYSKRIKKIESIMTVGFATEKAEDRSDRSKSMYVWLDDKTKSIKLEIGSNVRPDPYKQKVIKTYIHEFLEEHDGADDIENYGFQEISLNVLDITRTFIDKVMSVKRHAICGTIDKKARHIYDVTRLFHLPEIQKFLVNKNELRKLVKLTKETDSYYLEKRNINPDYDPTAAYDFDSWKHYLGEQVRSTYESLHKELLYTDEPQSFDEALKTFAEISEILKNIGE